jgi:hypothetical protein
MPRGFDLRQLQINLLDEQTLAVYDFDEKKMYLVAEAALNGDSGADARLVVAHESTHALQDQAFNLKRILPADTPNSDASTAARALVEGDAMLTMRIWGRQYLRPGEKRSLGDDAVPARDPVMDSAPPLVQGELLFPYDAGWVFAQLLYQDGGFEALNPAFNRPPTSTEQILHPEKYTAGERPVAVTIPALERWLGGTWVTRRTDVFGELVLRLLLEPTLGWPTAEAAAQGWGGDSYTILEDASGRRIVAMLTVWDTENDASEMYNAWSQSVPLVFKDTAQQTLALPSQTRWSSGEYQVQALTTGNTVRIVYAPDAATLDLVDSVLADAASNVTPAAPVNPSAPSSGNLPAPAGPSPAPVGPRPGTGDPAPRIPEQPSGQPGSNRFEPSGTPSVTPAASPEPAFTPVPPADVPTPQPTASPDDSEQDNSDD